MTIVLFLLLITNIASAQTLVSGNTTHPPTYYSFDYIEARVPQPMFGGWIYATYWYLPMQSYGSCSNPARTLTAVAYTTGVCSSTWGYKGQETVSFQEAAISAETTAQGWTQSNVFHTSIGRSVRYCDGFVFNSQPDDFSC